MASFAELSCFNKLLLEKMKKMEQKHKKEMEKHKEEMQKLYYTYDSLREETIMVGEGCDVEDIHYCEECELWFNSKYDKNCVGDYGVAWCCGECVNKGLCTLFNCENCGECFNNDKNHEDYMKKMHLDFNDEDVCNRCFKGYRILFLRAYYNLNLDGDVINEMVSNRDKVMEELLKKVKTN